MKKQYSFVIYWFATILLSGVSSNLCGAERYTADRLAPLEEYLMEAEREVGLATSAAHESVAADASVMVLRRHGYEHARKGSNGFVCLVERAWGGNLGWVGEFWDPKILAPICYNAKAAEYVLPVYLQRTEWVLAGKSRTEIAAAEEAAIVSGEFKSPPHAAMAYMMSADQYLHPDIHEWMPHLMIWMPYTTQEDWGNNPLAGPEPVVFRNPGGPFAMVVVPYGETRFIRH